MGSSQSKNYNSLNIYNCSWEIIDKSDLKLFPSEPCDETRQTENFDHKQISQNLDKTNNSTKMENKFVKLNPNDNWSDYTFVFASVSVGNVGQLAVDLMISSISNTNKCGYLISNLVQPIAGHDAFVQNSNDISLSCELYENKSQRLVIMQQRSPLLKGKRNEFVKLMTEFIKTENFKETICLTSSHAYERLDSQLTGIQCRYLTSKDSNKSILEDKLKWKLLEKRVDHNGNLSLVNNEQCDLEFFVPGGGVAQKFYKACKENDLNSTVLLVFAHEGNNIPEAFQLVNYLNEWKSYLSKSAQWRVPISWKHLFGQSIDSEAGIY